MSNTALELRSKISKSGELELSLAKVPVPEPGLESRTRMRKPSALSSM